MANYKEIQGFPIQNLSSDPVPYAQELINNPYAGVWSSGGNLNTGRGYLSHGAVGTQTSSLAFSGDTPGPTIVTVTENYDGSSWTEVNDMNVGRRDIQGFGTATAAFAAGGEGVPAPPTTTRFVESWNGTSWTETTDMPADKRNGGGAGTTTSGLVYGGNADPSGTRVATTYEWDGSSWTDGGNMNTARRYFAAYGIQTAAHAVSGNTPPYASQVEQYDGSSWTEIAEVNTARGAVSGNGTTTSGLIYGGTDGSYRTFTESWNGSSWTEVNDLSTAVGYHGSGGADNTSGLSFGGYLTASNVSATEEWAFSGLPPSTPAAGYSDAIVGQMYYNSTTGQFKAIKDGGQPTGTWASASGINSGRSYFAGAGTATDSMVFGGYAAPGPPTATVEDTEIWNGSSWTEVSNLNESPYYNMAGSGASSTAALCYSGQGAGVRRNNVESWDGSSWTEITGINTARSGAAGVGPQTAAMCFGGNTYNPPPSVVYQALTEIWNGSSWTEVNDLNTARGDIAPVGSAYTDVLGVSGSTGSNTTVNEAFNGSTWTELADTNTTASSRSGSGVPAGPTAIVSGGYAPGVTANTEAWDGSSWTETGDLATARGKSAESASSTTGFQVGGETPSTPKNTNVEEFSFDDFQINTLTTS